MRPSRVSGSLGGMPAADGDPDDASRLREPVRRADEPAGGGEMQRRPRGLFGRDRELQEADEGLDLVASGTPGALLVGGDAGIGTTTFAPAVAERAPGTGVPGHPPQ